MRFAGTRIEGFLGDTPDYGGLASGSSRLKSKESQAVTNLMGKTAATGISAAGKVKGEEIVGEAEQQMASAKSQAAMMGMIGKIGGAAIGAIPTSGSGGFGIGNYDISQPAPGGWTYNGPDLNFSGSNLPWIK